MGRPASFPERGALVPFTTPALAAARIRAAEGGRRECLLPGFSGGPGIYVVGWRGLPEVMGLTLHDRALHRALSAADAINPETVRRVALAVASRGFAGLAAAEAARGALARDADYALLTHTLLVAELLRWAGLDPAELVSASLGRDDRRDRARAALVGIAGRLRIVPDALSDRVEMLSRTVFPLGLKAAPADGRLRQGLARIAWLRDEMREWSGREHTETAAVAAAVAECAGMTEQVGRRRLDALDPLLGDVRALVMMDGQAIDQLRAGLEALSWIEDGWGYVDQLWQMALNESAEAQRAAICAIHQAMPVLPLRVLAANRNGETGELERVLRRWARDDGGTRAAIDLDAVQRLETVRARLA
jgi:hypothetical protein